MKKFELSAFIAICTAYWLTTSTGFFVGAATLSARVEIQGTEATPLMMQEVKREHGILGLDLSIQRGKMPVIKALLPDSPATQAHLQPEDKIVLINGQPTVGKSSPVVDAMLPDIPGESVELLIERSTQGYFSTTLKVMPLSAASARLKAYYGVVSKN